MLVGEDYTASASAGLVRIRAPIVAKDVLMGDTEPMPETIVKLTVELSSELFPHDGTDLRERACRIGPYANRRLPAQVSAAWDGVASYSRRPRRFLGSAVQ